MVLRGGMGEFAETIKGRRLELSLTQTEVARRAGVEPPYISQIEGGEKVPSVEVAVRLALALGLSREDLTRLAVGEKSPPEARAIFKPEPRFRELREFFLSRCQNRAEIEPEMKRADFSHFEEWLIRLLLSALTEGAWGSVPGEFPQALGFASEGELVGWLRGRLEWWRFSGFGSLEVKPRGEEAVQATAVQALPGGGGFGEAVRLRPHRPARQIPVVSLVQAGQGGFYDDQGYPVGQGMYSVSPPDDVKDENAYGVEVLGDSMVPRLNERDVVIASPAKQVMSGDMAVVRLHDDEVMIKRLRFRDNLVILESVNPAYEPIIISPDAIRFIHKVVWIKPR